MAFIDGTSTQLDSTTGRNQGNSGKKFKPFERSPRVTSQDLQPDVQGLKFTSLKEQFRSPLLIESRSDDFDLWAWLSTEKQQWLDLLHNYGALAFRGFHVNSVSQMEQFSSYTLDDIFLGNTEHRPVMGSSTVQVPVEFASDIKLLWHNENTFNQSWPQRAIFACGQPALQGGETPLVDSRLVYSSIPARIRDAFEKKGVMYVRKCGDNDNFGLGWRTLFGSDNRLEVERSLDQQNIQYEWLKTGDLITRSIRPGVWPHPITKELSWINQAQHWHFYCLPEKTRVAISKLFEDCDYPRNCFYGDGSIISDEDMQTILDQYPKYEVALPWQKGDVILVDNILCAHSRNPYVGQRKIFVCFGNMTSF